MAKNQNDEYYTPSEIADYCVTKTKEVLALPSDTIFLEPSAGAGVFLKFLPSNTIALDINPQHDNVLLGDFLEDNFTYEKGLCIIGNPPFGFRNTLAVKFFKKAIQVGDYISFILPISQLNNQQQMFEFDLIHSEDLGKQNYSGVEVHCCLNIYKRPKGGIYNHKPSYTVDGIYLHEYRRNGKQVPSEGWDWSCCSWGQSLGQTPTFVGQYAQEHYLYLDHPYKEEILTHLEGLNWLKVKPFTSTPKLQSWFILKLIKDFLATEGHKEKKEW